MSCLRSIFIVLVVAPLGCGATAGSSTYRGLQADYARSEPRAVQAATRMDAAESASPREGPVLGRAAFVRAVLRENPSIEAARQGWRAAIARVRQAGTFEDP